MALLFYWAPLNRQVRVEGIAEPVSEEESRDYFQRRPKKSQISAAVSEQSAPVDSRQTLIERYQQLDEKFADSAHVPKPKLWGGFLVAPRKYEFWQGQSSRLHDRIVFERPAPGQEVDGVLVKAAENGWVMTRLQP